MKIYRVTSLLVFFLLAPLASFGSVSGRDIFTSKQIGIEFGQHRGLVVVFLSSKCPCSNSHVEELRELAKEYNQFKFVAVHSNGDESENQARTYFKEIALPFPVIQDDKSLLADRFEAQKTPHAFVVLPDGKIAFRGGVTNSNEFARSTKKFLRNALADLQAGREVAVPEGRALGCFIMRNK